MAECVAMKTDSVGFVESTAVCVAAGGTDFISGFSKTKQASATVLVIHTKLFASFLGLSYATDYIFLPPFALKVFVFMPCTCIPGNVYLGASRGLVAPGLYLRKDRFTKKSRFPAVGTLFSPILSSV